MEIHKKVIRKYYEHNGNTLTDKICAILMVQLQPYSIDSVILRDTSQIQYQK